jgi:RNA polymerase sigma-70 factor (ECF subfamily)
MAEQAAPSFEGFFEREHVRLYRVLFAITGDRLEAEDISQEAFLRLWERWDRVGRMEDPAGYLHRTAINVFRDRLRRVKLSLRRALHAAPADEGFEAVDAMSVAASVLRNLAPRQRAAIVLTEALGFTADEAGSLLGIKGSTVRALHAQARASLRATREAIDV